MPQLELEHQGDLFPHRSPESLTLYAERLRRRIARLAPALSATETGRVLGEVALVESVLDRLEGFALTMARVRQESAPKRTHPQEAAPWAERFGRRLAGPPAWAVRRDPLPHRHGEAPVSGMQEAGGGPGSRPRVSDLSS